MQTVKVRDIVIGEGIPKICVPIMAKNEAELFESLEMIAGSKADIVEFRVDAYDRDMDEAVILEALRNIRNKIGNVVLLYTMRTVREGGYADIAVDRYVKLLESACAGGMIDLIDVEAYMWEGVLQKLCKTAHENNVRVIASNHDFNSTPDEDVIFKRLSEMDEMGADIPKIATMPQCEEDVLALLNATLRYKRMDRKPAVTMSMGKLGLISRLSGEVCGSAVTFASAGRESAPGQVGVGDVRYILNLMHDGRSD